MLQKLPAPHWDLKKMKLMMQLGEMKQEILRKHMTDPAPQGFMNKALASW